MDIASKSRSRSRAYEVLWAAFAMANLAAMFVLTDYQTVPFHLIWVSLVLLYGWAFVWSLRHTMAWFAVVTVTTGAALLYSVRLSGHTHEFDELTEIPLMGAVFLACVWHVRRRDAAAERAASLAASRQRLLDREREFLRDASHGLRTPIQVARGHAELLMRDTTDPGALDDLDVILDELDRLTRISDQLLLLAASEAPGFLRTTPLKLDDFAGNTLHRWQPTAERAWSLSIDWHGEVLADEERLRMAIDAVIENAVKYTDPGDAIGISLRSRGEMAAIEITDAGSGIPGSEIGRIFDRFSRDARPPTGRGGTGLGLSIVKAVVDAHDGVIHVDSTGEGTTFRIELPIVAGDPPPVPSSTSALAHV